MRRQGAGALGAVGRRRQGAQHTVAKGGKASSTRRGAAGQRAQRSRQGGTQVLIWGEAPAARYFTYQFIKKET